MNHTTNPVYIRARLDPERCGVAGEYFWATPTDKPDELTVANLLRYAPIGLDDVVRVEDPGGGEPPQVVEIVSRSKRVTLVLSVLRKQDWERFQEQIDSPDDSDLAGDPDDQDDWLDPLSPVDEAQLGLVASAVAKACQRQGGDVERVGPGAVVVRLPEGVAVSGHREADGQAWQAWLLPVTPVALGLADPERREFWLLADDIAGPQHQADGLITELQAPPASWHGPGPDFSSDPDFVAAYERADPPPWFTLQLAVDGAAAGYQCDERVRLAVASGHPRRFDDLMVESLSVACFARNLPMPPVDRVLWDFLPDRMPGGR